MSKTRSTALDDTLRDGPETRRSDLHADRRRLQETHRSDVKPILEALRQMIRRSELSQRQVEEAAGFSRGYLSQLLAQNLDLKVWHLMKILEIFGEHPGDFFHRLHTSRRSTPDALADFAARSAPAGDSLAASFDHLYRVGLDSLASLRQRLERMEGAVEQLESRGLIESSEE
ncbi:MAG: helix-turn-helix transcriptional regulator [Acidobacteriota bacterium]